MPKIAKQYLEVDPWKIIEKGFHPERAEVSESVFSLGNEFMGARGYFEEGYGGGQFIGSFFNGIFEEIDVSHAVNYKGFIRRFHFMVNSVDWLYTKIEAAGEKLDLAKSKFSKFNRELDLRTGKLVRSFVWKTKRGSIKLVFDRFTSMVQAELAYQRISFESVDFTGEIKLTMGLDFNTIHHERGVNYWNEVKKEAAGSGAAILGKTLRSGQHVYASMEIDAPGCTGKVIKSEKNISRQMSFKLKPGESKTVGKRVVNYADKSGATSAAVWKEGEKRRKALLKADFDSALKKHTGYWKKVWDELDMTIEGDPVNQQGVRFCIYQLHQTYHGVDANLNVSAKGLTGEEYGGHTWWDTETYCLPFYMFNNVKAAKNLLEYRYKTLEPAKIRAREKDCKGARYPMETIDGSESCTVWQHGDLEIHVPAAVAYGVWHYANNTGDTAFLYSHGAEMLVEISRYYASRGGWGQENGKFGFWCVMGADEFHMMVNNNCYTNFMAMKCFDYANEVLGQMQKKAPDKYKRLAKKTKLDEKEVREWKKMADNMYLPKDKKGVYEQHEGYFNMPHLDYKTIPNEDFPVYRNWAYYRIFRTDMIKQPDVLLMPFFYSHDFSDREKKINFEYYEPRCSHESSLSPGIHSILASELGKHDLAIKYWGHAARLDLDDYNNNTDAGLHTTSMAAAWMNVVYGFGGLRTDSPRLSFNPSLPKGWTKYSFRLRYKGALVVVTIDNKNVSFTRTGKDDVEVEVFGKTRKIGGKGLSVAMPKSRIGGK
ncbi:MAG: family 65 glycosyl hydrolase [Planctomycetes bacterium]|nr:family 65 glycosyl hydrolase [Planctomycetota bacterium]